MNPTIVFCEEPSCAEVVRSMSARLSLSDVVTVVEHQGKSDLRRSFPRKVRAWADQRARFIILHDQDASDCILLKAELSGMLPPARFEASSVRIVCRELEAWYLGDLDALVEAELISPSRLVSIRNDAKYRDPDSIAEPKRQFQTLHAETGAILLARRIAPFLNPDRSRSRSFRLFVRTLTGFARSHPD